MHANFSLQSSSKEDDGAPLPLIIHNTHVMISRYSIILVVGLVSIAAAFSFSPQQLAKTKQCNIQSHSALPMQFDDDDEYNTRRNFLTKVVETTVAPILLSSTQASAAVSKCRAYLMFLVAISLYLLSYTVISIS